MRIWMLGAEMAPYSKVGGLGDVLGALPDALARHGDEVAVFLPHMGDIDDAAHSIAPTGVEVHDPVSGQRAQVLETRTAEGVRVFFLDHPPFYHREGLYGTPKGDYPDNAQRFAFFCRAALLAGEKVFPGPDVVHAHDWQAALVPYLLRSGREENAGASRAFLVQSIHNLSYQGVFPKELLPELGIPWEDFIFTRLEFYDQLNFLKAGLVYADAITTVSPTYAEEIKSAEQGWGLDGVLRERAAVLHGILNGIDVGSWNPATDPALAARFDAGNLAARRKNTDALRKRMGLAPARKPIVGVVSRLVWQKGLDILLGLADRLDGIEVQWAILGTGEERYEDAVETLMERYPGDVAYHRGFDEALGRLIYGGADFFLMPSLFEPCGLGQMIAQRYGCLPVVRYTGGLIDTVADVAEGGAGFLFHEPHADALAWVLDRAARLWADSDAMNEARKRAMSLDFSWDASSLRYLDLYRQGVRARRDT